MATSLKLCGAGLLATALFVAGCKSNANKAAESGLTAPEARQIAKEAYIYGFPMAANYQTMYKQAIDTSSPDYRGTFNTLNSSKSVATPEDKFVVTPNSDTPYSYLWMNLRAEPCRDQHAQDRAQPLLHGADGRSLYV